MVLLSPLKSCATAARSFKKRAAHQTNAALRFRGNVFWPEWAVSRQVA